MSQTQMDVLPPAARQELLLRRADPAPLRLGTPVRAPRSRIRRARPVLTALVALLVLAVVALVHARGMYTGPLRFDDEGTYVSQARSLLDVGRLSPYTYWYDHPPLGWMLLSGWLAGPGALWHAPNLIGGGRQLMLVVDLLSVGVLLVLARRLGLSVAAAAAAGLLFALSPLALTYHRMVLLDNIATPLLLLAFVCAMSPKKHLGAAFASGLALAAAVLVKETTLLLLPFVVWTLWRAAAGPTRRMCVTVFGLGLALPALLYPLYALTKGELLPGPGHVSLWDGVLFQLFERRSSGSVLNAHSDAHQVVAGWLARDPYLLAAGAALVLPALLVRRLRPVAAALLFGMLAVLRPGYLPVPYVVALLPLAALVVAGASDTAVRRLASWLRPRVALVSRATMLRGGAAALVLVALLVAAPAGAGSAARHWYYGDRSLMQVDFDRPYTDSTAWLEHHVSPGRTLLVDNVTWTDLVEAGYPQRHLVWFTKPDFDQQIDRVITSWRDVDYVVSSDIMRTSLEAGPVLREAQLHSTVVASFGSGSNQIQVRKVNP
jgi:4-amino-4-deoxy-L-arabinose transferase-like glycosyltransferase